MILHRAMQVPASIGEVWEFFATPENLQLLTPAWLSFRIVTAPEGGLERGDELEYRIRIAGVPQMWRSTITTVKPPFLFADFQETGPYEWWHHYHLFTPVNRGTEIVDLVHYRLPLGRLGTIGGGMLVRIQLKMIFDFRKSRIREVFGGNE